MLTSPSRRATVETFPHYYPFGSHRVRDVVKDYSCGFGDDDTCSLKVIMGTCSFPSLPVKLCCWSLP